MCPSHGERRNGECAMRHKNISPADATDRHRNHAGCLSTTQIAPPVRRIGTDISQAERDVENVKAYMAEPKCSFIFTLNAYQGLFEAVEYDCKQENVDRIPNKLPIFMISGDDDPVGNLGEGVKKVYDMFQKSGKEDIT